MYPAYVLSAADDDVQMKGRGGWTPEQVAAMERAQTEPPVVIRRGPNGYDEEVLRRCAIAYHANPSSVLAFRHRLETDRELRKACGLNGKIPSQPTLHRYFKSVVVGNGIVIPERWLGRKSKKGERRAPAVKRIAEATGLSRDRVQKVLTGKSLGSYEDTIARFKSIGIEVSAYDAAKRVFNKSYKKKCGFCRQPFRARRVDRKWCSKVCGKSAFQRRIARDRLCNTCGKAADSRRYAWACRQHETQREAGHKRSRQRRKRLFEEKGVCISCSLLAATKGQLCLFCHKKYLERGAERRERQRQEWRKKGLLTVTQTAAFLGGWNQASVYKLISRGTLAVSALSGRKQTHIWLLKSEVERFQQWRSKMPTLPFVGLRDPSGVLTSLRALLPPEIPETVKDDAVSAMVVDVLEGRAQLSAYGDPTERIRLVSNYVKEAYKAQGDPYGTVSLDKPLSEDGDTLAAFLGEEDEDLEAVLDGV